MSRRETWSSLGHASRVVAANSRKARARGVRRGTEHLWLRALGIGRRLFGSRRWRRRTERRATMRAAGRGSNWRDLAGNVYGPVGRPGRATVLCSGARAAVRGPTARRSAGGDYGPRQVRSFSSSRRPGSSAGGGALQPLSRIRSRRFTMRRAARSGSPRSHSDRRLWSLAAESATAAGSTTTRAAGRAREYLR